MNGNNLQQIFQHYIDNFEYINEPGRQEYYKWQVCNSFPDLMKKALSADKDSFPAALYEAKKCTENIIDSYTQPFSGLVEFSREDPEAVRKMFLNLYADDGGDIKIQMEKISDFFNKSNELLDKYTPGSFLYKQNSHAVSAYLFLNDPDNHYMYKATQSQRFADCVEFYDDWGTGDNIKLDKYYRMCDELVAEIMDSSALLKNDESRFDGRLKILGGPLHPDKKKHILAFDIIYCCSVYDLFDGIAYTKRNAKEKQLYLSEKTKAQNLKKSFDVAKEEADNLKEALQCFVDMIHPGDVIHHKKYGDGEVDFVDEKYITATYPEKQVKMSLVIGIINDLIKTDSPNFAKTVEKYRDLLKRQNSIMNALDYSARALEPYEEYLD